MKPGTLPSVRRGVKTPTVYFVFDVGDNSHRVAYTRPDALKLITRAPDGSYIYLSRLGLRLPGVWVKRGGELVEQAETPADSLASRFTDNPARRRRKSSSRRRRSPRARANPALTIFANPRGSRRKRGHELISRAVKEIWYVHVDDGKLYRHDFARGVCAERLPDGSARLYRQDGRPVLRDFPAE